MRVAPMRIDVAEPSDSVSSPFAVLTTIELADASYFSSVPVTECATAFLAVLACAGEADAEVATASAKMPALSSWNMRDIWIVLPCPECGSCLDLTKRSAMRMPAAEMRQPS